LQRLLPDKGRHGASTSATRYVFFIRLGSKAIEFEKGKNAIAIPGLDKVPLVIDILITAVRNGELDEQLAQTKKPATMVKYLKTA
jgi:hypothetical protein